MIRAARGAAAVAAALLLTAPLALALSCASQPLDKSGGSSGRSSTTGGSTSAETGGSGGEPGPTGGGSTTGGVGTGGDPITHPGALLFDVLARCTELEYELSATFSAGCASAFTLQPLKTLVSPAVGDCVAARLSAERYDCAQTVSCAQARNYSIVTR